MNIVVIDNFDSFTYNLVHTVEQFSDQVVVMRNNKIDWEVLNTCDKIIFSPGPGLPQDVKIMGEILDKYKSIKPILGVCLGMQYIGIYFGGNIFNIGNVIHGIPKNTRVVDKTDCLFQNIPIEFNSGRYHSWALNSSSLPSCLFITAIDEDEVIMAIRHKEFNICGVQFHPESILTEHGFIILRNWLNA